MSEAEGVPFQTTVNAGQSEAGTGANPVRGKACIQLEEFTAPAIDSMEIWQDEFADVPTPNDITWTWQVVVLMTIVYECGIDPPKPSPVKVLGGSPTFAADAIAVR